MSALRLSRLLLVLAAASLGLAACENTIRGAGKDLHETGQAVEDAIKG